MDIIFFGTPNFSSYILEQLIKSQPGDGIIKAVVTAPDKPVGRKQVMTESAVSKTAKKYKIQILKPQNLSDLITHNLSLITCDLFIAASYGKIIPQTILDIPKHGSLNVHPSILPKYRGASPIQTAILNGDKKTGVTIMLMDAGMDHGPVLKTVKVEISKDETSESLTDKTAKIGSRLLIETIPLFVNGKIKPHPQDHDKATFCKLIKKEDGFFDIENPPSKEVLDRMIRAYYPWPTAWTKWHGKVVKFLPISDTSHITQNPSPFLVQMEGKKPVPFKDFLNGYPDFPKLFG